MTYPCKVKGELLGDVQAKSKILVCDMRRMVKEVKVDHCLLGEGRITKVNDRNTPEVFEEIVREKPFGVSETDDAQDSQMLKSLKHVEETQRRR